MNRRFWIVAVVGSALLAVLTFVGETRAQTEWINLGAGDWFDATNWSLASVPDSLTVAMINNGGEAQAAGAGTVQASRIDVGKNGGTGSLVSTGVDLAIATSFDIGDVELGFAIGNALVNSSGSVEIRDVASLTVGSAGVGDLDIGQTFAADTAQGFGTGSLLIERTALVDVAADVDVGETGGSATATGDGTLIVFDV
ncbi:MAG: hypothetical protein ACC645_20005, partial [Pirellulales bacterium]